MAPGAKVGAPWRHEIANIIAETEKNLGMKASMRPHVAPRGPPMSTLSATSWNSSVGNSSQSTTATTFTTQADMSAMVSNVANSEVPLPQTSAAVAAAVPSIAAEVAARQHAGSASLSAASAAEARAAFEATAAATSLEARATSQRLLETVKFELDFRGSMAEKQLQAVREEMQESMMATEKKWVDIARAVEASVGGQIEAESKLRKHCEQQLGAVRDAASTAHMETLKVVGEFQQTAIDHAQVLRRIDADLTAFRNSAESKLAQASIAVTQCVEGQQELARRVALAGVPTAGGEAGGASAGSGSSSSAGLGRGDAARLAEVEKSLLAERDFRKQLESEVWQAREAVSQSNVVATVEEAVASALERGVVGGGGVASAAAVASLDEKVKECGRLIVRMGTELMEETKRRQALEAEVQEMRMRLSGVEAVARSPLPAGGGMGMGSAFSAEFNGAYDGSAGDPYGGSDPFGVDSYGPYAASEMMVPQVAAEHGERAGGTSAGGGEGDQPLSTPAVQPSAMATAIANAMETPSGGASGVGESPDAGSGELGAAVDARLKELVPSIHAASIAASAVQTAPPATTSAASQPATSSDAEYAGTVPAPRTNRGAAANLRISQQELDARVQQILGRHGQALAVLGASSAGSGK